MTNKENPGKISRKSFIKKTTSGLIGTSLASGYYAFYKPGEKHIPKRILGNTGLDVTTLGFGATHTNEESVIRYALSKGINFIDTGRMYYNGRNEELIGRILKGRRSEFIIQSKVSINGAGSTREIRDVFNKSLEESLRALQTDYIDIYLLHDISDTKLLFSDSVLKLFARAKEEGKIRFTGFSSHSGQAGLVKYNNSHPLYEVILVAYNHSGGFVSNNTIHKWDQDELVTELKLAYAMGTGVVAMKTCSGGVYPAPPNQGGTLPKASQWVIQRDYIHAASVAMVSFENIDEHVNESIKAV